MKTETQGAGAPAKTTAGGSGSASGASNTPANDKMRYLSELNVFQDLSQREMEELNRVITVSNVPKGRVFYRPEETSEVLFILKEGRVQLYRISPEGKKLVISTLGPHTLFGEMALLTKSPRNSTVRATTPVDVLAVSKSDFSKLLANFGELGSEINRVAAARGK